MAGACHPPIMVDGAIAKHLEILRGMLLRRLCIIKSVDQRHAVKWHLFVAIYHCRERQPGSFKHSGGNVRYMAKLCTVLTSYLSALGPIVDHAIARAAKV